MKTILVTALLCSGLAACQSNSHRPGEHDSMMSNLSASQRRPIDEARVEQDHRTDALALARQAVVRAKAERSLAEANLVTAEAAASQAEAAVTVAQTGSTDDLGQATTNWKSAQAELPAKREMIRWHDCEITRCERAETLAKREEELAGHRVGLAKARAFAATDQAEGQNVDVPAHEARVSEGQRQVALASVELDAATRNCAVARGVYEASLPDRKP